MNLQGVFDDAASSDGAALPDVLLPSHATTIHPQVPCTDPALRLEDWLFHITNLVETEVPPLNQQPCPHGEGSSSMVENLHCFADRGRGGTIAYVTGEPNNPHMFLLPDVVFVPLLILGFDPAF